MSTFERLESVGLKQQIQTRLKQAILDGSLAPGEQMVEGEIAGQFGVSRSPVREAIQELERQGYVVKKPRRGTFVTELTPQTVIEVYSLRVLLEGYAAAIAAAKPHPELLQRMRGLAKQMEADARESDFVGFGEADRSFHNFLCDSAEHSRLIYLSQSLRTELGFHLALARYSDSELDKLIRDHWMLLDAIEAGQADQARNIVRQHIYAAGRLFLQKFFEPDARTAAEEEALMDRFWQAAQ